MSVDELFMTTSRMVSLLSQITQPLTLLRLSGTQQQLEHFSSPDVVTGGCDGEVLGHTAVVTLTLVTGPGPPHHLKVLLQAPDVQVVNSSFRSDLPDVIN